MKKLIALLIVALSFGGCLAQRVNMEISSFSDLPSPVKGSIHVLAIPAEKNDSLEWKTYRSKFEFGFERAGFTIAPIQSANYIAFVSYGIDDGQIVQGTISLPIWGSTGGGTTTFTGNVSTYGGIGSFSGTSYTMPTYGIVGTQLVPVSREIFTRTIAVDVVQWDNQNQELGNKVYESNLRSVGTCGLMVEVMDELIQGFFQKFPHSSGQTNVSANIDC